MLLESNVGRVPEHPLCPTVRGMAAVEIETLGERIALITLNRPRRLNAIDGSLIDAMDGALDALSSGEYRVAILTGPGADSAPVPT
ncbi:MAG: hypothetical protein QOH91_4365 [Mycobacterium sp.]|nr:hypothetical protein [Mycobacterium sp.]